MRRSHLAFLTGELLVSLTVLIPIMLVLVGVFPFAYSMDHKAADFLEAQEVARDELEQARGMPFKDLTSEEKTVTRGRLSLKVSRAVLTDGRVKRVELDVRWRSGEHFRLVSHIYGWAP